MSILFHTQHLDIPFAIAQKSPTLTHTLEISQQKIQHYFGPETVLRLKLVHDPEIEGHEQVIVEIISHLDARDAQQRLDRFDYEWWLEASQAEQAEICFLLVPA